MLNQIAVGSSLIAATVVVHAICTAGVIRLLQLSSERKWDQGSMAVRSSVIAVVVLFLCHATLIEAFIWAQFYVFVGAVASLEEALYFSTVTFTTLGYGDVVVDKDWRLVASLEAANGSIIFGWTTAIVVALLRHAVRHRIPGY